MLHPFFIVVSVYNIVLLLESGLASDVNESKLLSISDEELYPASRSCVEKQCSYITTEAEFWACVEESCSREETSEAGKRWVDQTHYEETRRSFLDNLENCIRRCYAEKRSEHLCARACRRSELRRMRSGGDLIKDEKKWVHKLMFMAPTNRERDEEKEEKDKRSSATLQKKWVEPLIYQRGAGKRNIENLRKTPSQNLASGSMIFSDTAPEICFILCKLRKPYPGNFCSEYCPAMLLNSIL